MSKANVMASAWRTGSMGCIGIVAVSRQDGWKAYIGLAGGYDERGDAEQIAHNGAPLMEPEARAFFPQFQETPYAY